MPAPKGNKNAVKDNPRTAQIKMICLPATKAKLQFIAQKRKITMTEVIEKYIDKEYQRLFEK